MILFRICLLFFAVPNLCRAVKKWEPPLVERTQIVHSADNLGSKIVYETDTDGIWEFYANGQLWHRHNKWEPERNVTDDYLPISEGFFEKQIAELQRDHGGSFGQQQKLAKNPKGSIRPKGITAGENVQQKSRATSGGSIRPTAAGATVSSSSIRQTSAIHHAGSLKSQGGSIRSMESKAEQSSATSGAHGGILPSNSSNNDTGETMNNQKKPSGSIRWMASMKIDGITPLKNSSSIRIVTEDAEAGQNAAGSIRPNGTRNALHVMPSMQSNIEQGRSKVRKNVRFELPHKVISK